MTHHGEIGDRREDVGEHEKVLDSVERRDWEAVLRTSAGAMPSATHAELSLLDGEGPAGAERGERHD